MNKTESILIRSCKRLAVCSCFVLASISSLAVSRSLGAEGGDSELVEMVIGFLEETDKDIRSLAYDQIRSEAPGEAATKAFAAKLADLPPENQVGLLSALADRGDAAARSSVVELLNKSKTKEVRVAALAALGAIGNTGDVELLLKSLTSSSTAEASAARRSLVQLKGEGTAKQMAAKIGSNSAQSVAIIEILAERRALDTITDLLKAALHNNTSIRTAAMTAMENLVNPSTFPHGTRRLKSSAWLGAIKRRTGGTVCVQPNRR